jgi:D-alanyl-D-alanine carboxypeptidase
MKARIDSVIWKQARDGKCLVTCKISDGRGDNYFSGFDGRTNQPVRDFSRTIDIGSCTKMFTAAAILQLVEQKKISLDDPLTSVLPDPDLYRGLSVFDGRDYIDSIRIRNLLNHTSGFPDYFIGSDSLEIILHSDSTLRFTPRQLISLAKRINKSSFRPGTSFGYSNVNYILLGLIIEKYTRMSYQRYVQLKILDPLQMKHTYFGSVNPPAQRAPGHYNRAVTVMPATMAGAAGEIISNLDDMQTFITAWNQGKLFRQASTIAQLKSADFHAMTTGVKYGLGLVNLMDISLGHAGQTFGFAAYMGAVSNGKTFVLGIDDAKVSVWNPAVELTLLLN